MSPNCESFTEQGFCPGVTVLGHRYDLIQSHVEHENVQYLYAEKGKICATPVINLRFWAPHWSEIEVEGFMEDRRGGDDVRMHSAQLARISGRTACIYVELRSEGMAGAQRIYTYGVKLPN